MIQLIGENYYFDLDEINNYISIEPKEPTSGDTEHSISVIKYEIVKMMMDLRKVAKKEQREFLDKLIADPIKSAKWVIAAIGALITIGAGLTVGGVSVDLWKKFRAWYYAMDRP